MMKAILLVVALVALAQQSVQLTCYNCKTPNYPSSLQQFKNIPECQGKDMKNWDTAEILGVSLDRCKKIVEKIKIKDKEEELIIRTTGAEDMALDKKVFEEYSCREDLCNSAVTVCATAFALVTSILTTLTAYF